ncbi:MAG TPA: response regulator [Rhodospirillales bacterium]|nr:response regulator [Rhodospirillales bacterium]
MGPPKALVISSEPLARKVLDRLLRRYGYWAQLAAGELDALDALEETDFDLLVLDTDTTDLDWSGLVKLVRVSRLGMEPLPVVALTSGHGGAADELDQLAVEAVLTKPLSPRVFLEALTGLSARGASSRSG